MSGDVACSCAARRVAVIDRHCNHSAFNGYKRTWSRYSAVVCLSCGQYWRTAAAYVDGAPDLPEHVDWRFPEERERARRALYPEDFP